MDSSSIIPVQIFAKSDHMTFVAADGSIYGMGGNKMARYPDDYA